MATLSVTATRSQKPLPGRKFSVLLLVRWLLLTMILSTLSATLALWSATTSLQQTLSTQLPARLAEALQFSFISDAEAIAMVSDAVSQDLGALSIAGRPALLRECSAHLIQILSAAPPQPVPHQNIPAGMLPVATTVRVNWDHGQYPETARFRLHCALDAPRLLGINAALALAVVLLMALLTPLLAQRLPWLLLGLKQHGFSIRGFGRALAIAFAPATLRFDHLHQTVTVHGITVALPKTPYFYYAWYAQLRHDGAHHTGNPAEKPAGNHHDRDGWLLNPATDRPDRASATSLVELMTSSGGHQKAINDLNEHGLRAKILDQNRNKVKDELCRVLGDNLAAPYLFESERDARTARYRYRLACPPTLIMLPMQASTSFNHS